MIRDKKGFTLIELLVVIVVIGILAAIAIPAFMNAMENAKRKATMGDLRNYGNALGMYYTENNAYPPDTNNINDLYNQLVPYAVSNINTKDSWRNDFAYDSGFDDYTVKSNGKDGIPALAWDPSDDTAVYDDYNLDILYSNGTFVSP